jgi:hypothetical protein
MLKLGLLHLLPEDGARGGRRPWRRKDSGDGRRPWRREDGGEGRGGAGRRANGGERRGGVRAVSYGGEGRGERRAASGVRMAASGEAASGRRPRGEAASGG